MRKVPALLAAAVLTVLPLTALAQGTRGDAAVRTGGVGLDERAAFNAERDRYNLRLAFAETNGEYVTDVDVRLSVPNGRVVYEGVTKGPFLFAKLDPGRYRLEAEHEGMTQVRTLDVSAAQAQPYLYLHWPTGAPDAEASG